MPETAIKKLRSFHEQFAALLYSVRTLRDRVNAIKLRLEEEAKGHFTTVSRETLSEFEVDYVLPAITNAITTLTAHEGTTQLWPNLESDLISAQADIDRYLRELEAEFPEY